MPFYIIKLRLTRMLVREQSYIWYWPKVTYLEL